MLLTATVLVAASALAPPPPAAEHGKIEWFEGNFVAALDAAEESGQLIFIDFWADW